jgi:alpha-glucosidase
VKGLTIKKNLLYFVRQQRFVGPAVLAALLCCRALAMPRQADGLGDEVHSPDGAIVATFRADASGQLVYTVQWRGQTVIPSSPIGVALTGITLGLKVDMGKAIRGTIDETYAMMGGKSMARNHANTITIPLQQDSVQGLTVEARAYDDGFAWRLMLNAPGTHHVVQETSEWTLPAQSKVWFAERNNAWKLKSYAGEYISTNVDDLPTVSSQGPIQTAPLVLELHSGGYMLLSEAELNNYSGMRLLALPGRKLQVNFAEGDTGFDVSGPLVTPWRVTLLAANLNDLVNSDLIANLNPAPDPKLFANTSYIRPGRAVWRYWSRNTGTELQEQQYVDYAAELGFEYSLVDDGWKLWPDAWASMHSLCAYAAAKNIGIFAWQDYQYIADPENDFQQLREFLDKSKAAGLAGVKIDFFNAESKDRVEFQRRALVLAAQRRLMVDFHGIQKPTGESRTFPNAITREAVRGIELNKMPEGPITPSHNAALPFTRFVVGPADYTPLSYTWPGATTWSQQLATLIAFTSPFQTIVEDPEILMHDAALHDAFDVTKAIPTTWDETRVLEPSAIGKLVVIARRKGKDWFLAVINSEEKPVTVDRPDLSFLGDHTYEAVVLTSPERRSFARRTIQDFTAATPLTSDTHGRLPLSAGDGLVAWFHAQ